MDEGGRSQLKFQHRHKLTSLQVPHTDSRVSLRQKLAAKFNSQGQRLSKPPWVAKAPGYTGQPVQVGAADCRHLLQSPTLRPSEELVEAFVRGRALDRESSA